jgi:tetratricopeptide (TPR) repeat protein
MAELTENLNFRRYLSREPVIIALLCVGAIIGFAAVGALSSMYRTQQQSLAVYWFQKGNTDLEQHHYERAAQEFHVALLYSRDNYSFRLNLAEALVGLGRVDEASTYFNNLWERQPENGLVNLELARIAVRDKNLEQALRSYHNAIYGVWPPEQETMRRQTRLELIDYLLRINAKRQAQAELIALAATLGNEPAQRRHLGDLFLRVQDNQDALSAYRAVLRAQPENAAALAGAGQASFELARYSEAARYLRAAVPKSPGNTSLAALLKTTELVLQMDPFRRGVPLAERNRIVIQAFQAAGDRLQTCMPATGLTQPTPAERSLPDTWDKMKPRITARSLRRDPSLAETAMDLVFDIERQTSVTCGTPTGTDMALLLIAKLHEGS